MWLRLLSLPHGSAAIAILLVSARNGGVQFVCKRREPHLQAQRSTSLKRAVDAVQKPMDGCQFAAQLAAAGQPLRLLLRLKADMFETDRSQLAHLQNPWMQHGPPGQRCVPPSKCGADAPNPGPHRTWSSRLKPLTASTAATRHPRLPAGASAAPCVLSGKYCRNSKRPAQTHVADELVYKLSTSRLCDAVWEILQELEAACSSNKSC
jgi:hypothetical protein